MGVVENIQTGSLTLTGTSDTVTVAAFDPARTEIGCSFRGGAGESDVAFVEMDTVSGTEIRFQRGDDVEPGSVDPFIEWWIKESSSGVDVQEITYAGGGTSSISAVDLNQSWIQPLGVQTLAGFSMGGNTYTENSFDDSTTVRHALGGDDDILSATLQVVNYDNAAVQFISNTTTSLIQDNAITPVSLANTFVLGSSTSGSVRNLDDCPGMLLTAPGNLRAERNDTASYDYSAFINELTDDSSVQTNEQLGVDVTTVNFTISAVDLSLSIPIAGTGMPFQVGGWSQSSNRNTVNAFFTNILTSTTNNRMQSHADDSGDQNPNSQVIEWNAVGPMVAGAGGMNAFIF